MTSSIGDVLMQKTEQEVVAALVHLRKLLRVRNRLRSPLLQLPTETIIRILSFVMAELDTYFYADVWSSIYSTCHRVHEIMCSATELWWKVDYTRARTAHLVLMRSKGNPRVIVSDLRSAHDVKLAVIEELLDHWRDRQGFRGHQLHTLEFFGSSSSFNHFSWIFERPLPCVRHLKIHVTDASGEAEFEFPLPDLVALELPVNMPLQVLDLRNVMLSWPSQSNLLNGLRELRLNFKDFDPPVVIPEDELFGILGASPQLEHLSLVRVGHEVPVKNGEPLEPLPPKRVLQFPNLASLTLDNDPVVVKYTLAYMNLPVITSLDIRSFVSWDIAQSPKIRFFPDDRLPTQLFPNPPKFVIRTIGVVGSDSSIVIDIGSIRLCLDFPLGEGARGRSAIMSRIFSLVPQSVTTLKLEYTQLNEQEWRDFFTSHPEVRSIECAEFCQVPVSKSLWDALSPAGEDAGVLCPRLESIFFTSYTGNVVFTHLLDCLRSRHTAGFKLRLFKMKDYHQLMTGVHRFPEELYPFVEVVEARKPSSIEQRVSTVSMCGLDIY